jgi:hypothetical protein
MIMLPTRQERVRIKYQRVQAGMVCLVVIEQIMKHREVIRKNSEEYGEF